MIRTGQTFECDSCGITQHVNPREFRWHKGTRSVDGSQCERILAAHYEWEVVRPAGTLNKQAPGEVKAALAQDPGHHRCKVCRPVPDNVVEFRRQ